MKTYKILLEVNTEHSFEQFKQYVRQSIEYFNKEMYDADTNTVIDKVIIQDEEVLDKDKNLI